MSESKFRRELAKRQRRKGKHVQLIENMISRGVPDINWSWPDSWVELKFFKKFPAREATKLDLRHFTWEQVWWLTDRGKAGGIAYLITKVGDEFFVHNWPCLAHLKEHGATQQSFRVLACGVFDSWEKLLDFINEPTSIINRRR